MDEFIAACLSFEVEQKTIVSNCPVCILGQWYDTGKDSSAIQHDVRSRVWLTYRRNFPPLTDGGGTTDRGWGCMVRCGQMLLAEAVLRRQLGRSWRWSEDCRDPTYLKLVSMFEDQELAPFSLHVMTSVGRTVARKAVGEWYGPHTVAQVIKALPEFDVWNNFVVSLSMMSILIIDEMRELSKKSHPKGWDPLLIVVPTNMGMDTFNPIYTKMLQTCFHIPQCLGILGGTPSHALFLIGYVGDKVIYLDPHTTQDSAAVGKKETEEQKAADLSYHCAATPHMPINRLCPSMSLCFLCNSESEFDSFISRVRRDIVESLAPNICVEIMDTRPDYMKENVDDDYAYEEEQQEEEEVEEEESNVPVGDQCSDFLISQVWSSVDDNSLDNDESSRCLDGESVIKYRTAAGTKYDRCTDSGKLAEIVTVGSLLACVDRTWNHCVAAVSRLFSK